MMPAGSVLGRLLFLSSVSHVSVSSALLLPSEHPGMKQSMTHSLLLWATSDEYSWQQYTTDHSSLQRQYEKAGGILYRQSILSLDEYNICKRELNMLIGRGGSLRLADETTSSVASGRVGGRIPSDSALIDILGNQNGSIARIINEVEGDGGSNGKMVLSKDVPIEVRIYEKTGAGMEWHVDDVLFQPEQVEIVLTMENTSDCVTIWEEGTTKGGTNPRQIQVETTPNSAILIKAGGARHRVSALRNGRRVILKFVYMREGAKFVDGAEKYINQFASSSSSSRSKKQKRTKKKR